MKNTLKILVVSATFGAILAGCGSSTEGNNDAANTSTTPAAGSKDKTPSTPAPETKATPEANAPAGAPAGDTKAPAGDTKAPAGDAKAPAGDAKTPAGDANTPAADPTKK